MRYSDSDGSNRTLCAPVEPTPLRSLPDQLQLGTRTLIESISGLKCDAVKERLDEMIEYLLDLIALHESD